MQYRTGFVNVTNGSANVVGSATSFSTNVTPGCLFTVVGSGVTYIISAVADDTHFTLSVPYAGTTQSGATYTISKSFTPNQHLPYIEKGDVETATILKAAFLQLDQTIDLNTVITTPVAGQVLEYNGSLWVNTTPEASVGYIYLDDFVTSQGFPGGYGANVTSGAPDVTLPEAVGALRFSAAMVGQSAMCSGFTGFVTVASYISPTHITMSTNATSSTTYGRINVFQTGSDDTSAIVAADAAAVGQKAKLITGNRSYVVGSPITLTSCQSFEGLNDNTSWFIPKGLFGIGSGTAPKGDMFTYPNAPDAFQLRNIGFVGPGSRVPAYLSQMVMSGGVLTATVTNNTVMDAGAVIRLQGSRNAAYHLRWTNFKLRTGGSAPTTTGFIGDAVTWDGRPGYAAITNVAITAGVITLTTSATNFFESEEQGYVQSLATATFLNGVRYAITNTIQGTTSVSLTMPNWFVSSVSLSGSTATYTGTFPAGSLAGTVVTFSGFTNTGNNGAFTVTSSSSTTIVVTNASAVNETPTVSAVGLLTTYTSASDTGNLSYIQDGTYTDTASAVHQYSGFELWCHPSQGSTITNRTCIEHVTAINFQGDQILWHQPNYAYLDRVACFGGNGGLCLMSAYPTTGRFTDPSAFEVRGGNQLYGACFGFAAVRAAGLTIGMIGSNASGIAILFDNCSGVGVSGLDLESERPMSGQSDLWPGNHIEVVGGSGLKIAGVFNYEGFQSNSTTPNVATGTMFYAWGGATAFSYSASFHCAGSGYVQQNFEIVTDSSCSNFYIGEIDLTTTSAANLSIAGTAPYETNLLGVNTKVSNVNGGLFLPTGTASTNSANHSSPALALQTTYWNGSASAIGGFKLQATPANGTNPTETLNINHSGSPGGSKLSYQNGTFTVDGQGFTQLVSTGVANSGANNNSPTLSWLGQYWNGSASATDSWGSGATYATGSNPVSTLTLFHSGSSGGGQFAIFAASLYSFTGSAFTIGITTASTSTSTGSLILAGGMGVAGAGYFGSLFDSGNRVLTNLTAGTAISISGSGPTGVTVTNTGVTALAGTTNQVSVSASTGSVTLSLPQNINSGAAPTFAGTNFTSIPNAALTNSSVTVTAGTGMSGGGAVSLGSAVTLTNAGVLSLTQGTTAGVTISASTGAITIDTVQDIRTSAQPSFVGITLPGTASITNAITSTTAATSLSNKSSPILSIGGNYWNGSASTADNFTVQTIYGSGTNPVATLSFGHSGTSGGSAYSFNNNLTIGGSGVFSLIKTLTTVNAGVPIVQKNVNLTAQTANVAATAITGATTQAGLYRISFYIVVSQAALTSSTLPDTELIYTDRDSGAVITIPMTAAKTTNTTSTYAFADAVINAASATNIQYAIGQNSPYASVGSPVMNFAFRAIEELLG